MNNPYSNYAYAVTTANAKRSPNKVAISYRGQQQTFEQLTAEVNRCANALHDNGIYEGMRVAVLLHDALPIAHCYLALAKLGAVLVAVNPYWTDDVMREVLQHSDVDAFVFQQSDSERLQTVMAAIESLRVAIPWGETCPLNQAMTTASSEEPLLAQGGDAAMAFFFTSGTTGLPKAVVHTHNSCRSMAELWLALPRNEQSVWGTGTIIWGIGFPCTIGAALFVGMPVALEDDFGPAGLLQAIQQQAISHMAVIPSFWSDLLANHAHEDIDLSAIQLVVLGGEPLANTLLEKIKARIPQAAIFAFYGQTEAPYTCFGRLDDGSQAANVAGPARPTCAAKVLAPDGSAVRNQSGELAVSGPHLMREYYKRPEKTEEALRDGWFFSGDLAIQDDDGRITVLGRRDDAIVREGQYYQPLQIEDAALAIPGVDEAAALGLASGDPQSQSILLAIASQQALNSDQIHKALASVLPATLLPKHIVVSDELPHNNDNSGGRGKLAKLKIRQQYEHLEQLA